jgi:hypothetical protein
MMFLSALSCPVYADLTTFLTKKISHILIKLLLRSPQTNTNIIFLYNYYTVCLKYLTNIILSVVLYGRETWTLALRMETQNERV